MDTVRIQSGYSQATRRIQSEYREDTVRIQGGYSQDTEVVVVALVCFSIFATVLSVSEVLTASSYLCTLEHLLFFFFSL